MGDDTFVTTRTAVQCLSEHILSAARYAATGRIGLAVTPGGIATPAFGDDGTSVGIINGLLVVRDRNGARQAAPTTLAAAGVFVGVTPGAPESVYTPSTACELDDPIHLDSADFARIAAWYELVDTALQRFAEEIVADEPSGVTVWPEHFDAAIRAADINYGGLAGDAGIMEPYIYIGPPNDALAASDDPFWNESFGAIRTASTITSVDAAVEFFHEGRTASGRLSGG